MQKRPEDQKREESLYQFLSKSYADYQKGQQAQMHKIMDEICRKNKEVNSIQQWMELFTRLLLAVHKNGGDTKLIIDIVLYKIPWFSSETHFQAIQHFKKIIFTILSLNSNHIGSAYRMLVQRLHMIMTEQEVQSKYDIPCEIKGVHFVDKIALNDRIHDMCSDYQLTHEDQMKILSKEHKEFMLDILHYHPNASQKLKGMVDIGYGYFPSMNKTKCFYIIRNGSQEDISYIKAVEGFYDQQFRAKYFLTGDNKFSRFAIQIISEIDIIYKLHRVKLLEVIQEQFPHKNQNDMNLRVYTMNVLRLAEKIPEIAPKIVKIIYTKFLSIDSEIKSDYSHNNIVIKTRNFKLKDHKDEMSKKLDQLMFILFDFLNSKLGIADTKSLFQCEFNEDIIVGTFKEMQKVFQEVVLKNQHYRMAHFLYIYFCSLGDRFKSFQQLFITQLILNIRSNNVPKVQRINSIFYLSSLLVRCNTIQSAVFIKAVQIIIDFYRDGQHDIDFDSHLIQMLAYLSSTKRQLEPLREQIYSIIIEAHQKYNSVSYLHYDVLVKFNDVLLRSRSDDQTQRLIEITANVIAENLKKRCQGEATSMSNTPQVFMMDHESHMSRQSIFTNIAKSNSLDFYQPFNSLTLIYSENFIKQFYKYDTELIKDEQGSLDNSYQSGETPQKKVKC